MNRPKKIFTNERSLYVVIQQYRDGKWGIADTWFKLRYASTSYKNALEMRDVIANASMLYAPKVWNRKRFAVNKFSPLPPKPSRKSKGRSKTKSPRA